jgi:glycosyltransferase involved in cell wall biosynthesis
MPARCTLSVAIITHNEEQNLARTLASVAWADQVVVVDAHSTDGTAALARSAGAQVIERAWPGFAAQKNFALSQCTGDWILSLDADEEVSPDLAQEMLALLANPPAADAFYLPRRNYFLGRAMLRGGFYPDYKLRLFRRGRASFAERAVHETLHCSGPTLHLNGDLLHHAYPTLSSYIEHMNRYSTLGAEVLLAEKRPVRSLPIFLGRVVLAPAANFFYNYIARLGFLDGRIRKLEVRQDLGAHALEQRS